GLLGGMPDPGSAGIYAMLITAQNSSGSRTQSFTLTVIQAPAFSSANATTFTTGSASSFSVTASGFPTPSFSEKGALPSGITFSGNGQFSGTPGPGSGGVYPISITASNATGAATQSFTLTVNQTPTFTSPSSTTFTAGSTNSFTVSANGFPEPTF